MITISKAKEALLKAHPKHTPVQWANYKNGYVINAYPEDDEYHMVTLDPFFEITSAGKVLPFSPVFDIGWFDNAIWHSF